MQFIIIPVCAIVLFFSKKESLIFNDLRLGMSEGILFVYKVSVFATAGKSALHSAFTITKLGGRRMEVKVGFYPD